MNYTPGPWTVAARVVSKRPATVVLDADKNEVCEVYACSALIAAAPDLLAALESLNAAVIRAGYGNTAMPELTQAWAAIAKATGEIEA